MAGDPDEVVEVTFAVRMMGTPKEASASKIADGASGKDPADHDFSRKTITRGALLEIRQRIESARQQNRSQTRPRWMPWDEDHSRLVEVFLYERDVEAAWREAQTGGCSDTLWLRLAEARERDHPEDAVPIYLKQTEVAVTTTRNSVYDNAVELLVKAAALMKRMGRSEEFVGRLESLRQKYKIKRNFVKRLEQRRKSLNLQ